MGRPHPAILRTPHRRIPAAWPLFAVVFLAALLNATVSEVSAQTTNVFFFDDFNRANSTNLGSATNSFDGSSYAWSKGGLSNSVVTLTSSNLSLATPATNGREWAFVQLTNVAGFNTTYSSSTASSIEWYFNMRQGRGDPSGFGSGSYAPAFVLGANASSLTNAGTFGYAVVYGQSGATDPIRLVSFTNGLTADTNLTSIITATNVGQDIGNQYLSLKLTLDIATTTWTLTGTTNSSFVDPWTNSSMLSLGSAVNSTYTSSTLSFMGAFWNHANGTASTNTALFDNFRVTAVTNAAPASFNWTGGSGNWTNGFGSAPTNGAALAFSAAGGGLATNDLSALTVGSIAFNSGAGSFTNSGNAFTISNGIVNNSASTQVISNAITLGAAQTFNAASGALTLAGSITNGDNLLTLTVASNSTVSGIISGGGGLTKSGAGTATISAANTFGGAVSVTAGALRATHGSALGTNSTGTTVSSGAALELSGGISISGEALSLAGSGISSGGALRNISGNNTYGGLITLSAATRISSDAGTLTLDVASGNAITGTHNLTFAGAGHVTVNDAIATSTGTLTKEGAGTLMLAGANTFTGAVAVNAGTLALTNGSALADTVAVTLADTAGVLLKVDSNETIGSLSGGSNSTVDLGTNSLTLNQSANVTNTAAITNTGTLIKSGAGTLTLNRATAIGADFTLRINQGIVDLDRGGASVFGMLGANNAVELNGGTLEFSSNAGDETGVNAKSFSLLSSSTILINRTTGAASHTTTMSTPFLFANNATVTLDYVGAITSGNKATTTYSGANTLNSDATIRVQNSAGGTAEVIFSGVFSDGGSGFGLTKLGAQTMTLSAANTYTGDTVVGQGTLQLSGSGRIADGSRVVVSNGATMNFNSVSDTIEGLSGAGSVALGSATVTLSNIATDTFSGVISGTGAIIKRGAGTQVLSGANTYSGATTVGGGTLRISGNTNLGNTSTTITLSNAGILDVTAAGTLTNAITIGAGNGVLSNSSAGALVIAGAVSKNGTVLTSRSGSGTNVFTGVISGESANSDFIVDGGTTVFSNVMTYNGPTIITNGGTLVLGTNNAMPSGSNLILGGGTFRVGVANYNTADPALVFGSLTLTENSTIDFGIFEGGVRRLSFANSAAITWATNAVLTITNWQGVALAQSDVTKLLFGTGGLDSDQLAQIRFADQNITGGVLVGLNGELSPIPEADIIYAALALALFILWRERRRLLHFVRSVTPPRY